MLRKTLFIFVAVVLSFALLVGCNGGGGDTSSSTPENQNANTNESNSSAEQSGTADKDATVIIGISAPVLTLDPANYRDRTTESVLRNIFDGLVTRTPDGSVEAMIAESWENPTPTEWIFTIREGVTFHDGSDLTVDDVIFTFERTITEGAIAGNTSPRKGLIGPLVGVEKVDERRVKFILEEPWPILISMLPHHQIVPKDYLEQVGDEEFAKSPIGAGPYKLKEASLDERIVLERYDDYYAGASEIKTLVFDVIPENSSRIAALQSGSVHRIQGVSPELIPQLEKSGNIEVKSANGTRVYKVEMNNEKAPFDDLRVRQAMNHAVNMEVIVDLILEGYGNRLAGPILKESFGLNKDLTAYEHNPEKAKQLLAEAGYENGFSVVIDTKDTENQVALAIATQLRDVGIDAQIRVWDWGVLLPLIQNGERMMYLTDWGNSTQDPYDFLNPKLRTDDRGNYSFYSNARVDELLDQASIEIDAQKREQMYYEAQEIIYNEAPWVFGYSMMEIEAGVQNLKNWEPASDAMLNMHDVYLE